MNSYLYILPFKDKKHFKIGISGNNFNRVYMHDNTYDIDLDKSITYHAKRSTVRSIENILLNTTKNIDNFSGLDGCTEVRSIEDLQSCMDILNDFERKQLVVKKSIPQKPIKKYNYNKKITVRNYKKEVKNVKTFSYKKNNQNHLKTIFDISENIDEYKNYALFDGMVLIYLNTKKESPEDYLKIILKKYN